jgi:hypothetical protein
MANMKTSGKKTRGDSRRIFSSFPEGSEEQTEDTNKNDAVKYISEGTYGCVFDSEIQCLTSNINKADKKRYVSKVSDNADNKELHIGTLITSLKQYDYFFSPILSSCPIDIGIIANDQIQKCKIITENIDKKTQYVSSKILFVGDNTLTDFFYIRFNNRFNQENTLMSLFMTTNIHLLKGIDKLLSLPNPIIHFDIKEQNILIHDKYNIPIIIDFGISFTYNEIITAFNNDKDLHLYFYNYSRYLPWTIEISFISFIAIRMKENSINFDVTLVQDFINDFYGIIDDFSTNNPIFDGNDEIKTFTDAMKTYVEFFKSSTMKFFTKELMQNWVSWDNYSIAVMYKRILDLHYLLNIPKNQYVLDYYKILKKVLLFTPSIEGKILREVPKQTIQNITQLSFI